MEARTRLPSGVPGSLISLTEILPSKAASNCFFSRWDHRPYPHPPLVMVAACVCTRQLIGNCKRVRPFSCYLRMTRHTRAQTRKASSNQYWIEMSMTAIGVVGARRTCSLSLTASRIVSTYKEKQGDACVCCVVRCMLYTEVFRLPLCVNACARTSASVVGNSCPRVFLDHTKSPLTTTSKLPSIWACMGRYLRAYTCAFQMRSAFFFCDVYIQP